VTRFNGVAMALRRCYGYPWGRPIDAVVADLSPVTICLPATEVISIDEMASADTVVWWCRICDQHGRGAGSGTLERAKPSGGPQTSVVRRSMGRPGGAGGTDAHR